MAVRFVGKQYRFSLVYDFTTTKPTAVADYTTLKFFEFNIDGAPDPSKWTYDLVQVMEVGVMVKRKPIPIVQKCNSSGWKFGRNYFTIEAAARMLKTIHGQL
jgi:hypothetical protein